MFFKWKEATLEECAWQIAKVSAQNTNTVIRYYKENAEVLLKLQEARILAKRYRALIKAERITEELLSEGLQIADHTTSQCKGLDK